MFSTTNVSKVELPPVFAKSDNQYWDAVRLCLQVPYFHVRCETLGTTEFEERGGIFLLSQLNQLVDIATDESVRVSDVFLMSPARINGSSDWKLEPLSAIWVGHEKDQNRQQFAYVFELVDGSRYLDASIASSEAELANIQLIVRL